MNFFYDTDEETTERISGYRDNIYDHVVDRFRELIADDAMDSALALADEFYEWMHPDHSEEEPTIFFNEQELRERYIQLTNGWWVYEDTGLGVYQSTKRKTFRWCWGYTPWDQHNEEAMRWP